jgi:chemotaxis protein methyltransferase CheR
MKVFTSMRFDEIQIFLETVLPDMGYRWKRFDRRNVRRRVGSRMESLRIYELAKYTQLVIRDQTERGILDSLLRLTITRFFRNSWLWSDLERLFQGVESSLGQTEALKVWSAGCAGGEEPYSVAMLLDDLYRSGRIKHPWTILGTDTDENSLERAQKAKYKWGTVREVPRPLLERWFRKEDGLWTLADEIRNLVKVHQHNLLTINPPGLFHVVLLRNSILTYNTEEVQLKVLGRIHRCLLDPGYLVIGRTETIPEGMGFEEVSKCIYRKDGG